LLTVGLIVGFREGDWLGLDEGCEADDVKIDETRNVSVCLDVTVGIRGILKYRVYIYTQHNTTEGQRDMLTLDGPIVGFDEGDPVDAVIGHSTFSFSS